MSIHDGHRQRLKQRFLEEGLESFTDIQVLELLLFFSVPRQDTNPIAHALLDLSAACIRCWKRRWRNCGRSRAWANSRHCCSAS